jgi:hypothetical protein
LIFGFVELVFFQTVALGQVFFLDFFALLLAGVWISEDEGIREDGAENGLELGEDFGTRNHMLQKGVVKTEESERADKSFADVGITIMFRPGLNYPQQYIFRVHLRFREQEGTIRRTNFGKGLESKQDKATVTEKQT